MEGERFASFFFSKISNDIGESLSRIFSSHSVRRYFRVQCFFFVTIYWHLEDVNGVVETC